MKRLFVMLFCAGLTQACSSGDDSTDNELEDLLEVTSEVVYFIFTPDTGNNTSKLEYQIKFTNPNPLGVNGFPKITTNTDGLIISTISTTENQCYTITADSDCYYTFEGEDSHNLGIPNNISLVSVEYNLDTSN